MTSGKTIIKEIQTYPYKIQKFLDSFCSQCNKNTHNCLQCSNIYADKCVL